MRPGKLHVWLLLLLHAACSMYALHAQAYLHVRPLVRVARSSTLATRITSCQLAVPEGHGHGHGYYSFRE